MRSIRLPLVIGALGVLVLAGAAFALRRDPSRRHLEILPADMVRSRALPTGGICPEFSDGLVQRRPPEGTVPLGSPYPEYGPSPEEAARAGRELTNPVPLSDAAALARGAAVFANQCATCHGAGGLGDAPVTKRGVPPPPSLLRPESRALADGEIWHAIVFGRKNMPSAAFQVPEEDRWKVIRHLRLLQEAK